MFRISEFKIKGFINNLIIQIQFAKWLENNKSQTHQTRNKTSYFRKHSYQFLKVPNIYHILLLLQPQSKLKLIFLKSLCKSFTFNRTKNCFFNFRPLREKPPIITLNIVILIIQSHICCKSQTASKKILSEYFFKRFGWITWLCKISFVVNCSCILIQYNSLFLLRLAIWCIVSFKARSNEKFKILEYFLT